MLATQRDGYSTPEAHAHSATHQVRPVVRWSLRWKLGVGAVVISTVPLALTGLLLLDINRRALVTENRTLRLAVADDVARTITDTLNHIHDHLTAVALMLTQIDSPAESRIAIALAAVDSSTWIDHVAVYDLEGQLIDTIRTDLSRDIPIPQTMARAALLASRLGAADDPDSEFPTTNAPAPIRVGNTLRVPLVVPLGPAGATTGYLTTWAPLTPIRHRIERLSSTLFPETQAAITLIDHHKRFLVHTDPSQTLAAADPHFLGPLATTNPTDFHQAFAVTSDYEDESGQWMTGSAVKVAGLPWAVLVRIRTDVAYASLNRMRTVVAATVASITVISLLLGIGLAHYWLRPVHSLMRLAGHLSERTFSSRVEVSQSDELGVLSEAMNQAAANLESSERQLRTEWAIRADLGRYLPAPIVEKIVRREQDMALGGKRQTITVVFADVVAFTPLTETLPPEAIVSLLNELFTVLTEVVFRHGGTVDKFIGDCVMALFGAPEPQLDHAQAAVRAAEDMLSFVESANTRWEDQFGTQIQIAIGIHSGLAIIGNIGSSRRMEYTAIGDVVNTAARLETLAQPRQILVTDAVRLQAGPAFEYNDLGFRNLVGKEEAVHIFEVRT